MALDFVPNQYVVIDDQAYRFDGEKLVGLAKSKGNVPKPKNIEQAMLLDLLWQDDIKAKVATGVAGSGKTFLSLRVGLAKVAAGKYAKVVVLRNPVVIGKQIGYMKGNDEKIAPWQRPLVDNVDGGRIEFDTLVRRGQIEFDVIGSIQGASIRDSYILVTEAQNLSTLEAKMIGTRCGEGSVLVFDGDIEQAGEAHYRKDSGIAAVIDTFSGDPWFGHVQLTTSVRGIVAEQFGKRL